MPVDEPGMLWSGAGLRVLQPRLDAGRLTCLISAPSLRDGQPRCFEPSNASSWERVLILNYVALVIGFLLPFLTIIVCYSRLIRCLMARSSLSGSRQSSTACSNKNCRSVHLVTIVTATFLLFFLPYHLVRSLHLHAVCDKWDCAITVALQRAVVVTLCLAASNSVVNPLLYYYSTRMFRHNVRKAQSSLVSVREGFALIKKYTGRRSPGSTVQQGTSENSRL